MDACQYGEKPCKDLQGRLRRSIFVKMITHGENFSNSTWTSF